MTNKLKKKNYRTVAVFSRYYRSGDWPSIKQADWSN